MNIQSAINKEVFLPGDERMLVAVEVRRRKKKRMSFLPTGSKGEYATFLCLSVTNKKPPQLLITKVKRFGDSSSFTRRSQWTVDQLKQVNGVNANKDSADFDLIFDNATDEWVACSSAEKCIFVQILYHACQTYWEGSLGTKVPDKKARRSPSLDEQLAKAGPSKGQTSPKPKSRSLQARRKSYSPPRQTEFINCQSKLTAEACGVNLVIYRCKAFFNRMKKMMVRPRGRSPARGQAGQRLPGGTLGSVVQKAKQGMGERGEKLKTAETKTIDLMHKAQRFADSTHKVALKKK